MFGVFISYNYKEYGEIIMNDDRLITILGSLGCIANSTGRIFWCMVFDYVPFKKLMGSLNCCLLICCLLSVFVQNEYVFMGVVVLAYFLSGSFYGIMPTQTFRVFGDEVGALVYPFVYMGFAFASVSQFVFHEVGIRNWGDEGFRIAFIVFGVFQIGSILAVLQFKFGYLNEKGRGKEGSKQDSIDHN